MYWLGVLLLTVPASWAQLTAQTNVAPELRECYTDPSLLNRNNLPPTTMPVLIDIIRQIEDNPNVNVDLRQLAVLLLHTYRQDGIEFHQPESINSANVLPFAPTFHSFARHRLLLTRIIQNNLLTIANNTISAPLKCALHHMLSTTVDARVRGDESNCNQLQQYRALRTGRGIRSVDDDVEILDLAAMRNSKGRGQYNPNADFEYAGGSKSEKQVLGDSQCPLLGGVVHTSWGAVSAGHLIAGIAAGAQLQQIPILELTKSSSLNYANVQQSVLSIYPATLSGDLSEAALLQGTERGSTSISIGAAGGWNTTEARRHFMLQSRTNLEMTDPEIRGDVDGFVLGSNVPSVLTMNSGLRLSTLLDMFYSERNGVFDPNLRACNRLALAQSNIVDTTLAAETYAFAAALDTNMLLRGTITGGLDQLVTSAVQNFQSYMTSNLHDMTCATTITTDFDYRLRTNIYIVVDASWQYLAVYPAISNILDSIDVSKFGSSVTLLSAADGSIVVNTTYSIAEFHAEYTAVKHQAILNSVNLETVFTNVRTLMHNTLDVERTSNFIGGNSSVLLFLINSGNIQNNERVWDIARSLNETVPDLRVLFATSTNQFDNLWNLVRDMHSDIMTIALNTAGTNLLQTLAPLRERIHHVARRIINPLCGSNYPHDTNSGARQFEDFVEPGYINFYSVSPNYFYENNDNRRIRIIRTGGGVGSLIICHSRRNPQPRQNATISGAEESDVICTTIAAAGNVEINLQNACSGFSTINSCPLFYISVQSSVGTATTTTAVCLEAHCRFPYSVRYQVQIDQLGCFSAANSIGISVILLLAAFFLAL